MSDGLFIQNEDTETWGRPKSKKEIRERLAKGAVDTIKVERTSIFERGARQPLLTTFEVGAKIDFVGPDPYTNRKFYGRLTVTKTGVKLT